MGARGAWDAEVGGSNPLAPTTKLCISLDIIDIYENIR